MAYINVCEKQIYSTSGFYTHPWVEKNVQMIIPKYIRKYIGIKNSVGGGIKPDKIATLREPTYSDPWGRVVDFGDSLGIDFYYRHPRSYARRGIFSIDEPSPTIRGVNRPVPMGYPGHQGDAAAISERIRPLTTKERSMIQTFPKDWILKGSKTDLEQIIGNAVPVNLAKFVGESILENLDEKSINYEAKRKSA